MTGFQNVTETPEALATHAMSEALAAAVEPRDSRMDPVRAELLLVRAQERRARGELAEAQLLAKEALEQCVRAHGERHAALVPFLLVYAGVLNQCLGWAAGKPFYDRAQRLRSLVAPMR